MIRHTGMGRSGNHVLRRFRRRWAVCDCLSQRSRKASLPPCEVGGTANLTGETALLHMTMLLTDAAPALAQIGWAAGRRGDRLLIAVQDRRPRSWLYVKRAFLECLNDDEYVAYESLLPVPEQHRRIDITWADRAMSRRAAMLRHLDKHTDESYAAYEAALPAGEMRRRVTYLTAGRVDLDLPTDRQPVLV